MWLYPCSFVFTVFDNEEKFKHRLRELAVGHWRRGIKTTEYGIIGANRFSHAFTADC
jgi:hypothetical protein